MGFPRQEYWSGLLCHSPGDLPNPGFEPASLMFPAWAGRFFTTSATWEAHTSTSTHTHTHTHLQIHAYMHKHIYTCMHAQSCLTRCNSMDLSPPGSSVHGDSPGKDTGVDCHAILQGIFPTQGSNPGLPPLQVKSLPSKPPGKSKNTGVGNLLAYPFSRGTSQPRNQTKVSCFAGGFFTS